MSDMSSVATNLVTSRRLILQTKLLMIVSLQRRLRETRQPAFQQRIERFQADADRARSSYRKTVLDYGSPESQDYWLVAYGSLVQTGNALASRLRTAAPSLPVTDRYEVSADIEALEYILDRWTESLRKTMAESVA